MHSMNSAASWKQLNDGLNHLFPVQNKKSSLPNRPLGSCNPATAYGSQNRMPELRKSSSRSSLYDELESSEDVDQRYHTVTGMPNRKNTLVALPQMAMQTRNPMLDGGLVMRNDEEMRTLAPSPIPWTGLTQGTSPESRPVLVNGHPPHPQAHPTRTPTEISEAIRILDESHKHQMTELRMRMDSLHREYSREHEKYSRERQELRTKLQQALSSQEVCSDPVNMPLPGLYPASQSMMPNVTPMMTPAPTAAVAPVSVAPAGSVILDNVPGMMEAGV